MILTEHYKGGSKMGKDITIKDVKEIAKSFDVNIKSSNFGDYFYFPTEKHWVKIDTNLDGVIYVDKESMENGLCNARKAKSTSKFNPSKQYIVNCFKAI